MFVEGHAVKMGLCAIEKPQKWLVGQLCDRGIATCTTELSSVLSGRRKGPKAQAILTTSMEILRDG